MKCDILAIGAHPDDVELGCGGTLAKLISEGKKVAIVDLTEGELGTRGSAEIRLLEAQRAMEILGASYRENLRMKDGFVFSTEENRMKIAQVVRKYRPEIVLCNAIDDRHPDHAHAAKLISDACFLSGLIKVETRWDDELQQAHRPKQVFHYIQWKNLDPDFLIDITGFIAKKVACCTVYSSQFYDPHSKEPLTEISTKNFLESITYRAQDLGRLGGVLHAEGFTLEKPLVLQNFKGIIC